MLVRTPVLPAAVAVREQKHEKIQDQDQDQETLCAGVDETVPG